MAIGARITSTNLSGKTATVTFVPYTGQTSGSTINLGTKTIPFNNINSHPYGIYSLHFAEYDYTYTLTIPEPLNGVQLFVHSDKMVGSDIFGVATLNFNDFTAEIINLNVNINDWGNRDIHELNESGFMYYFRGQNNSADRLVIFTDASNNEIGRYSGTTNSFSRNSLEGRWVTAEFADLGVLKYSDGISLYTYTWNPDTHYIDIEWDWDASTSDGALIIKKFEIGSWTYNGNGESYIVNPNDGTTTLFKTWTDGTYVRHLMNRTANFIVVQTQNQAGNNNYLNFQICNTSGTVLETISLSGATYDNYNAEFHGTNKFTIVYYCYNDIDVAYKIIHYNGNTETLIETSHARGTTYGNINTIGNSDFWPSSNGINNGGIVLNFYNQVNNNNIGVITTYCDFMYMLDNQTSFSTYTYADNETKTFSPWGIQLSDIIRILCDDGSSYVSFLTITSGSTYSESTGVLVADVYNINYTYLGNKTLLQIFTNNNNNVTYKYVNAAGVITDTLNYQLSAPWNTGFNSSGGVCYVKINTLSDGNFGFYLTNNSTGFTETTYYNNSSRSDYYYSEDSQMTDVLFLWAEGGGYGRVLTPTGITPQFEIPTFNNYNVRVGKDKFMIVYNDYNDNDYIKFNLYDFSGTLLNSETTTYTQFSDSWGVKDRFIVKIYNGNDSTNIFYLVSENVITSVTIDSVDSEDKINDYIWYD